MWACTQTHPLGSYSHFIANRAFKRLVSTESGIRFFQIPQPTFFPYLLFSISDFGDLRFSKKKPQPQIPLLC